jgi:hypothetical protein
MRRVCEFLDVRVHYSWINRKAMAEGCKWKGYLWYEAGKIVQGLRIANSVCLLS